MAISLAVPSDTMDDLPDPLTCPDCSTVLVDGRDGWACRHCGVLVVWDEQVRMPTGFDGPTIG